MHRRVEPPGRADGGNEFTLEGSATGDCTRIGNGATILIVQRGIPMPNDDGIEQFKAPVIDIEVRPQSLKNR
jgi:hypothetical protein